MLFQSDKLEFLFEYFAIKHQRFCLTEKKPYYMKISVKHRQTQFIKTFADSLLSYYVNHITDYCENNIKEIYPLHVTNDF